MENKDYIFFLGGHDLEMLEIRNILVEKGYIENVDFFDKNLSWGAKISDYKDHLDIKDKTLVGIELALDIETPENYKNINHHNEFSSYPSSIEQIASLLNIKLNRQQELIAANDRGYIPEMLNYGACDIEIKEIRYRDRLSQNITEDDYKQDVNDCINNLKTIQDVKVVKTETQKFSSITDYLFPFDKLIVYNKQTINYYGINSFKLQKKYTKIIIEGKAYYGGGENGYFGFCNDAIPFGDFDKIINEIIELVMHPFSYHIFLFPFKWDIIKKDVSELFENFNFKQRTEINEFSILIEQNNWTRNSFKIDNNKDYAESNYFYKFVNEALFDDKEAISNNVLISYKYNCSDSNPAFIISLTEDAIDSNKKIFFQKEPNTGKYQFDLKIDKILLNIYNTGVAVLSYHLINDKYENEDEILYINEFGRRFYPAFLGNENVVDTKKVFLADSIELRGVKKDTVIESFKHYEEFDEIKKNPFRLPVYITDLLGKNFKTKEPFEKNDIYTRWFTDDRMFVMCWYGNSELSDKLKVPSGKKYAYEYNDFWYKFVFIDKDYPTCQQVSMFENSISKATYERFVEWNQLYGISDYSVVLLTNRSDFILNQTLTHFITIYFRILLVSLAQRLSILRFSDEITKISSFIDKPSALEHITILNKEYLKFINQLYFREITPQQQGNEMYNKLITAFNIENNVNNLYREIDELYQFTNNDDINKLSKLGIYFLPLSLVISILSISIFAQPWGKTANFGLGWKIFIIFAVILLIIIFSNFIFKKLMCIDKRVRLISKKIKNLKLCKNA